MNILLTLLLVLFPTEDKIKIERCLDKTLLRKYGNRPLFCN